MLMAVKLPKFVIFAGLVVALSFSMPRGVFASTIYGSGVYGSGTYAGSAPIVTTDSASAIGQTSATLGGTITSIGSTSPSVRGFVYGANTTYSATTTDSAGPFSTGSFSAAISSLTCNTGYHFAAYATSTNGIGYGSDLTFTTSACSVAGGSIPPPVIVTGGGGTISSPLSVEVHSVQPVAAATSTSPGPALVKARPNAMHLGQNRKMNEKGEDIRSLQRFLNLNGFVVAQSGPGSIGIETSIFGIRTYRALVQFQSAHGLPATGFLGPLTRGTINGQ